MEFWMNMSGAGSWEYLSPGQGRQAPGRAKLLRS